MCNFLLAGSWYMMGYVMSRFIPTRVPFKWIFCSTSRRFKASTAVLIRWESLRGKSLAPHCVGLCHISLVYKFLTFCLDCRRNTNNGPLLAPPSNSVVWCEFWTWCIPEVNWEQDMNRKSYPKQSKLAHIEIKSVNYKQWPAGGIRKRYISHNAVMWM